MKYKIEVKAFGKSCIEYESNNIMKILEKYSYYLSNKYLGNIYVYENNNGEWVLIR